MALHSDDKTWIKLIRDTEDGFQETWDFIDNLKMDPNNHVSQFAAKMNSNFSQLRDIIPCVGIINIPAALGERTNAVCEGIHDNTIQHTHLQYLKYFFIARLPKAIIQLVASKDPATFSEAHKETIKIQDLTRNKNNKGCSSVEIRDESINQIKGNRTQNPFCGNYRGHGGRGQGAPRGAPIGHGGYNGNNGNGQPKRDNQLQNGTKPTCWYCNIYGHCQEDCNSVLRFSEKGIVTSLNYVPKTFFSNDFDLVFGVSTENKFIFKENYVHLSGIFQKDRQQEFSFSTKIPTQFHNDIAIPMDKCNQ
jgi:hypothetical protein